MSDAKKTDSRDDEAILTEARKRFEYEEGVNHGNRENARSDTRFVYIPGAQWSDDVRTTRKQWKDPCYEFNQLKQFIHQVVNDQRQNRPGIKIDPAGGQASTQVADILKGMIRAIEYDSQAAAIYDNGYQQCVVGGRGYWRVVSEYENKTSHDQKICIKPISDPDMVRLDPDYEEPDGSDRNWGFVIEAVRKDEFERLWPDAEPLSWSEIDVYWRDGDEFVFVADYYRRVATTRTLVRMSNGAVGFKDEMPTPPPEISETNSREVEDYSIEWYKIAGGQQILAKYECPGEIIPIICVPGDETVIDGERIYQGLIRGARDAQSMFNYGMTQQAIHLALTPRAPYVMAEGQDETRENMWQSANVANYGALIYKPTTIDGMMVPPPQRTQASSPDAGWINWTQQMTGMVRSTIGMYENSLGLHGQETSGRAIMAREKQGDNATYHFVDNQARAIALTGRIIVSWIPYYYDTPRLVHIVGQDDIREQIMVNQPGVDPMNPLNAIRHNDVTVGDYAVVIESGPSYATKRMEIADTLNSLVNSYPPLMQIAGDLVVRAQDIPNAAEIADRIQMSLPPNIQQAIAAKQQKNQPGGGAPPDPQMMQAMQEKDQQLQQAAQTMDAMHQKIQEFESGMATEQMKEQSRIASEQAKEQTKAAVEQAKLDAEQQRISEENVTKRYQVIVDAASKIVAQAMTLSPEQQAASVDAATAEMAPVVGDGDNLLREMSQGLLAMAQAMHESNANVAQLARISAMPRETQLITDPHTGMPVSSISQVYQGTI